VTKYDCDRIKLRIASCLAKNNSPNRAQPHQGFRFGSCGFDHTHPPPLQHILQGAAFNTLRCPHKTGMMDEFNSETDSDYTSYWRDWVCSGNFLALCISWTFFRVEKSGLRMRKSLDQFDPTSEPCHRRCWVECRSFCSAHRTYLLPAEATAVVMAIGKSIFMAPSQSPNCTAGRIPFAMGCALRNLAR
jgi:hypothetical protein